MNSRKIFILTLVGILAASVLLLSQNAYAQTDQTVVKNELNRICLQGTGDTTLKQTTVTKPAQNVDVQVGGGGFGNAGDVYVALCLSGPDKTVCSTGDPALDNEIFGADFTLDIKNITASGGTWGSTVYDAQNTGNLSVQISPNKIVPSGGTISTNVHINNALGHFVYPFYGFYQAPAVTEATGTGGQKQGTFTFEGADKNCVTILWDPYGRVFDSRSLEPIPNIQVKALTGISPVEKLAQIFGNPQSTLADGVFNFLVQPGTYYLRVSNLPSKYSFTATPKLDPNYAKVYSKQDGSTSIYKPDQPIIEVAGKPEHRDIPLDPGTNPPGHYPVVNMTSFGFNQMAVGNSIKFG